MKIAIPGFLGLLDEWENECYKAYPLWKYTPAPFVEWAKKFNSSYRGELIGYSLGGRLALHALIDAPDNWQRATIISAHPGLDRDLRFARLEDDYVWAERFYNDSWDSVMADWNKRPVFQHDAPIHRQEKDFSRLKLAQALTTWSLGIQDSLHEAISKLPMQINWVVGEKDLPFLAQAQMLEFKNPRSRVIVVPNAGHRIPLELVAKISF
jgi:2-succinyl-6-hydroxy-2,4-cyclohexadiene-1-carboxylate synthase